MAQPTGSLTVDSPLGLLTLTSAAGAIVALDWGRLGDDRPDPVLEEAARQLRDYFAGTRLDFDLPLSPRGTAFRQKVWAAMQAIPYGGVLTYGDVARMLETAPRAVGGACGANPIPVIIPCHRIVGGCGSPGGYSGLGGLRTKDWLLRHERRYRVTAEQAGDTLELQLP
ncbi:methylated-DNA-[protein]-cysteine S-methyltransferase [Azospirillum sp. OGB3]|uniref:methylated-DNA--[protein]-cysteine S-methyltransferase n=1 Tax=Azospirillum sp. OGB3 TaxID=2587012 RepID=UPI001606E27B|nr:methylated-DNA--[protein]-cysteine S-methyltransferase [Azospirillum sp. OGB3]MBB3263018.1 methylated-DNA-[protein]-cysteine S-methyltransferase [Azospirillum sp. OGB3]